MSVKSVYKPVMCAAFFVTLFSGVASASSIQQCVAQACSTSSHNVSIGEFLNREKSVHSKLEEFYSKYRADIHKIRQQRKRAVKSAIDFLGETDQVSDSIRSLSNLDLMKLLVENSPWNTETDYVGGKYIVVAEPLVGDPDKGKVIKAIFNRLKTISSLYNAQLKVDQLNTEPRTALGIGENIDFAQYITDYLKVQIQSLPAASRTKYQSRFEEGLGQLEKFKAQYGEKVYIYLGDLDLEIQVLLGKMNFLKGERATIEQILIDMIPGVINSRSNEIANLETIYSASQWDKVCRAAYNRSLHYGLTQAEKDRIELQMKPEAIRRSEQSLVKIFGAEMTGKIIGFVNTMQIGGPLSFPEYVSRAEENIKHHLEDSAKANRTMLEMYDLVNSLGGDEDGAIGSLCNGWIFEPLRDSVSGNNVILSSFSAKNYEVGLSIAIHEMAHAASVALDLLKRRGVDITPFEEIRACISENYKDSDRPAVYDQSDFIADKLWTEEDWADAFAGFSMPDLQTNAKCGFQGALPEHDYATMSERSEDTHSPTFYRILNVHAHLGNQTPNQCKAPLAEDYNNMKFEDCITKFTQNQ